MQNENTPSDQQQEPVTLERALNIAISLHQAQRLDEAEPIYRLILEQYPEHPDALHFLGLLMHHRGDNQQAIELIEQAIEVSPEHSDAYNNLGNILNFTGEFNKAAEQYRKALALNPANASAHNNLGIVLKDLIDSDEAIRAFLKAIELMPDNPEFYRNLGDVLKRQGNFKDAAEAYRTALNLRAYNPEDYENLCMTLYLQGNVEEAIPVVEQWLQHEPDNALALHRFAAFTGENMVRATDEYVSQTFDGFAKSFDHVLQGLDYKAPFLVTDAVVQFCSIKSVKPTILDAGCGTGLCGALLKPHAEKLIGVDISKNMLERAEMRDCYDQLIQSELTAFIDSQSNCFDVIVSADTLVYFGDLEAVCRAANVALLPEGYLIFTLEGTEETVSQGYKINPHGRFSHSEAYVLRVLELVGLKRVKLEKVMLRYEAGVPVDGFLVVASKGF